MRSVDRTRPYTAYHLLPANNNEDFFILQRDVAYNGRMTPEIYREELIKRGFVFYEKKNLWVGPFNVQINGQWNWDLRPFVETARIEQLAMLDEQIRAKRGLPRPPSSGGPGSGLYSF